MKNLIRIGDVEIHRDEANRYCLNDLHLASGGHENNKPSQWLRTKIAKKYVKFLLSRGVNMHPGNPIETVFGGAHAGTYATKELVYSYAQWLSVEFHHEVITAYDATVMAEHNKLESAQKRLRRATVRDENCLSVVFGQKDNSMTHKMFMTMELLGLISIVTELRPSYRKEVTPAGYEYLSGCSKDGVVRVKPEKHSELVALVRGAMVDQSGGVKC